MIGQLLDKAPCGYFSFLDDGTLSHVNETLGSILQCDSRQLPGRNVESIFTLPTRIFFQTHLFPLIKMHGHAEEIFISLLGSNGQHVPVLLNANRMEWEQRMLTCCACIVVPTRKKFEDELITARNTAEQALRENSELVKAKEEIQRHLQQLETQMQLVNTQNHELQQFSHAVTHNLKEPLRKILLYTDRLQSQNGLPDIKKLGQATDKMKAVVTALQQYVWLDEKANRFSTVELNDVIAGALAQIKKEHSSGVLTLQYDPLPAIEGDADQLHLLAYHVLSNAVKFRKNDSVNVTIHSTVLNQNRFRAMEGRYKYESYVRLVITDDGIGFDPDYRESIFQLFKKAHVSEGLGLGLALSRKIVANHSGQIEADSRIDEFTKITVWLPVKQT